MASKSAPCCLSQFMSSGSTFSLKVAADHWDSLTENKHRLLHLKTMAKVVVSRLLKLKIDSLLSFKQTHNPIYLCVTVKVCSISSYLWV